MAPWAAILDGEYVLTSGNLPWRTLLSFRLTTVSRVVYSLLVALKGETERALNFEGDPSINSFILTALVGIISVYVT